MPYDIKVASQAAKYIAKLDSKSRTRFRERIEDLKTDPQGNSKPLVNSNPPARSCRVGDWRMILIIREEDGVVVIAAVGPRGQVYGRL